MLKFIGVKSQNDRKILQDGIVYLQQGSQQENSVLLSYIYGLESLAEELRDKLSHRNMQIRELKKKIARAIYERTCPRDEQNRMRCKECFLNKDCIIVR